MCPSFHVLSEFNIEGIYQASVHVEDLLIYIYGLLESSRFPFANILRCGMIGGSSSLTPR